MHRIRHSLSLAAVAVATLAAACSDATGPAAVRNNSGTGTGTLRVTADIEASTNNGSVRTEYSVRLRDNAGNAVSGATVTIRNRSLGMISLAETGQGTGSYFNSRLEFPNGDFQLDVVRGADTVRGVVLGGPGIHTITAPTTGSTAAAGQPMTVRWTVPSMAKVAVVENDDFGPFAVPDTGAFTIGGAFNPANNNQIVTVSRYNEVDIAGGILGSRLRVTVEQSVTPISVQ